MFLAAGSVILALHHEQDIFKMGGLRKKLPVPFWAMLIGSLGLVAFPLTSGFFSKDAILLTAYGHGEMGWLFWLGGVLAAGLTALYTTRMMVVAFWGEAKTEPHPGGGANMVLPLVLLAALALGGGWFGFTALDGLLGEIQEFSHFDPIALATTLVPVAGIGLGWLAFGGRIDAGRWFERGAGGGLRRFFGSGWAFDWAYDRAFVRPFVRLAEANRNDVVDWVYRVTVGIVRGFHHVGALLQTGRLRWYAANMALGLVVLFLIVVWA